MIVLLVVLVGLGLDLSASRSFQRRFRWLVFFLRLDVRILCMLLCNECLAFLPIELALLQKKLFLLHHVRIRTAEIPPPPPPPPLLLLRLLLRLLLLLLLLRSSSSSPSSSSSSSSSSKYLRGTSISDCGNGHVCCFNQRRWDCIGSSLLSFLSRGCSSS